MIMMYEVFVAALLPTLVSSTSLNKRSPPPASFEVEDMQTSVEAPAGSTVRLSCPVRHLGTRTVVWLKDNDVHYFLAIGEMVWISDSRFSASFEERSNSTSPITTNTLRITRVTAEDSGSYHCEVTTKQRLRSPSIELVVTDPVPTVQTTDSDVSYQFIDLNQQIVLNCQMPQGVDGPLSWFKNGVIVTADDTDTDNSGTTVTINQVDATDNTGASSTLVISQARLSDAGSYICRGYNQLWGRHQLRTTTVHVLVPDSNNLRNSIIGS